MWQRLLQTVQPPGAAAGAEFFQGIVEAGAVNLLVVGADRVVRYASPACVAMLGADPTGQRCEELVSDQVLGHLDRLLRDAFDGSAPSPPQEFQFRVPGGAFGTVLVRVRFVSLLRTPQVRGVVLEFLDVSKEHARADALARKAFFDELTGLPNRMLFLDRLETALRTQVEGSAAVIDVDLLKAFNHAHGHSEGDRMLQRIGQELVAALPKIATVARLGGDEFAVFLPGTSPAQAQQQLEAAAASLAAAGVGLTLSIGLASARDALADVVVQHCEVAMYAAKARGRHQLVVFDDRVRKVLDGRRELASAVVELQARNRELFDEARTDSLTGLRNRLALAEAMERGLGETGSEWIRTGVAFIDIDHFGSYNKLHSDAAGDQVLRAVAQALQRCLRDTDRLFRKGGEEFVALLPDVDRAAALAAAERLRATVEALAIPHAGSTVSPVLTVTVGVACGSTGRLVGELLHEAAELAMTAKLGGRRNRVIDA